VLGLVGAGLGNKAIAAELGISEQAAKEHVSALLRRFGATSRAALAEVGTQLQILGSHDGDVSWLPYLFIEAPMGIAVLRGPEHRIVAVNATNRRVLDREVVGLPFQEAFPTSAVLPLLDRVYATGDPEREYEFAGTWVRDGRSQTGYGDYVVQPIRDPEGAVTGLMVFGSDVTERVVARHEAERLNAEQLAIFDLVQEGVIVADTTGRLIKINDAARRIAGMPLDFAEQVEARVTQFQLRHDSGEPLADAEIPLVRALAGETVPWAEFIAVRPVDGTDVRLRVSAEPMRGADGSIIGGVVVFRRVRGG
jgi:PAS domain-containing protein